MTERKIPRAAQAEKVVLGTIVLKNETIHDVAAVLKPSDFFDRRSQDIYSSAIHLIDNGSCADLVTIKNHLGDRCDVAYLVDVLSDNMPTSNLEHYVRIVKDKSILRQLAEAGEVITSAALAADEPLEVLAMAEQHVLRMGDDMNLPDFVFLPDTVHSTMEMLDRMASSSMTGLSTGYRAIDSYTAGLQKGELIILAARPGHGKTALALNIASNVSRVGGTVGMFSMEMTTDQLNLRLLCALSSVDSMRLKTGSISEQDWNSLIDGLKNFNSMKLHINDKSSITIREVSSVSRRLKKRFGLDLLIIDYMQLMSGGFKAGTRQQEISDISRALKGLSKELDCPVLCLSQLSRGTESREDHRPKLSDLRESGAIEQDADVVIGLYRDELYNKTEENHNMAEIIFLKQRNGRIGSEDILYLKQFTRFENYNSYGVPPRGDDDQGPTTRGQLDSSRKDRRYISTDDPQGGLLDM